MGMRNLGWEAKRVIRTAQTFFPGIVEIKSTLQLGLSKVLRRPFEAEFQALRLLGREPGRLYLDVGANRGQSIAAIRMTANQPRIVSFEANPMLARKLQKRYEAVAEIRVEALGLGDKEGSFTLYTPSYRGYVFDGLASLDREAAMTWIGPLAVLRFDPKKLQCHTTTCQVKTLDSLALEPFFIKIDVEKYEMKVLQGAAETLSRYQPILLIESDNLDLSTYLKAFGYRPFVYNSRTHRFLEGQIGKLYFVPETKLSLIESGLRG